MSLTLQNFCRLSIRFISKSGKCVIDQGLTIRPLPLAVNCAPFSWSDFNVLQHHWQMMKIRPYTESDYSAVLDIYAASKLDELRYEEARFELLPLDRDMKRLGQLLESEIFICEDTCIVGYCAKHGSEIRALFVHPNSRGRGIGRCMLEFILARIRGPATLYVAKTNSPAKKLYGQYGFQVVEEFATSYNGIPVFADKMTRFGEEP